MAKSNKLSFNKEEEAPYDTVNRGSLASFSGVGIRPVPAFGVTIRADKSLIRRQSRPNLTTCTLSRSLPSEFLREFINKPNSQLFILAILRRCILPGFQDKSMLQDIDLNEMFFPFVSRSKRPRTRSPSTPAPWTWPRPSTGREACAVCTREPVPPFSGVSLPAYTLS